LFWLYAVCFVVFIYLNVKYCYVLLKMLKRKKRKKKKFYFDMETSGSWKKKKKKHVSNRLCCISSPCPVGCEDCPCTVDRFFSTLTPPLDALLALPQWAGGMKAEKFHSKRKRKRVYFLKMKHYCRVCVCVSVRPTLGGGSSGGACSSLCLVLDAQAERMSSWCWNFSSSLSRPSISSWRSGRALDT